MNPIVIIQTSQYNVSDNTRLRLFHFTDEEVRFPQRETQCELPDSFLLLTEIDKAYVG